MNRQKPIVLTPRGELVFTALAGVAAIIIIPACFWVMASLAGVS